MESINDARMGNITQEEFIKTNASKAIGAVLLIIPGVFTDIVGIALQFGLFLAILGKIFHFKKPNSDQYYKDNYRQFTYTNNTNYTRRDQNEEIIDVEIIDDSKSIKH